MLSTIKGYLLAAGGLVVAIFSAMFVYRGKKIEAQKKDIETEKANVKAVENAIETIQAKVELQEEYNEIEADIKQSSIDSIDDRLSKFDRD